MCQHRNYFNPKGTFGVCPFHFTNDCFTRAVHIKGTEKRLKPGSVPTIWKKATVSLSGRSRWQVSRIFLQSVIFAYLSLLSCDVRHSWNTHTSKYVLATTTRVLCLESSCFIFINCRHLQTDLSLPHTFPQIRYAYFYWVCHVHQLAGLIMIKILPSSISQQYNQ